MNEMIARLTAIAALITAPFAYAQTPAPPVPPPALASDGVSARKMSSTEALNTLFELNGPLAANSGQCQTRPFGLLARALQSEAKNVSKKKEQESAVEYQERLRRTAQVIYGRQISVCLPFDGPGVAMTYSPSEQMIYGRFNREFDVDVFRKSRGPQTIPTDTTPFKVELTEGFVSAASLDIPKAMPCLIEWNRRELEKKMPEPPKEEPWRESFKWPRNEFEFRMSATAGDETSLRSRGRFIIVGRLTSPWFAESGRNLPATRHDPIIRDDTVFTLHIAAEKFVVLDAAGKERWSCSVSSQAQ
ncbi:hypothetical protein [Sphingopyxis sp. DBS4]|uniref:hypothetical protein n=1 Tax=Sphingopyxis sp. DBS4 TaxID=2968500 RepID=UPI00214D0DDE|nr:hypothetical protein [Sphingopyxis sp. DBS4]